MLCSPAVVAPCSTRAANLALTCPCQELSSALNLTLLFMWFALAGRGVFRGELHQSLCASISLQSESSTRPSTARGNRWQSCPPADHKSSYSEDTVHITPKQEIYQVILMNSPPLKHLSAGWRGDALLQGNVVCSHARGRASHPKNVCGGSLLPLLDCTEISLHCFHFFIVFNISSSPAAASNQTWKHPDATHPGLGKMRPTRTGAKQPGLTKHCRANPMRDAGIAQAQKCVFGCFSDSTEKENHWERKASWKLEGWEAVMGT